MGLGDHQLEWGDGATREHHGDVFVGGIIEGPSKWAVRPVAEFFYEDEFGKSETISGLVGLIWRVSDNRA
jgi:hypothetical protein